MNAPDHVRPQQLEDEVPTRAILGVAAATVFVFLVGIAGAWEIMHKAQEHDLPHGAAAIPAQIGMPEQGIVFQRPFDQLREAESLATADRRRLESYGWVDRSRGIVHIPIGQAMDRIAKGERP